MNWLDYERKKKTHTEYIMLDVVILNAIKEGIDRLGGRLYTNSEFTVEVEGQVTRLFSVDPSGMLVDVDKSEVVSKGIYSATYDSDNLYISLIESPEDLFKINLSFLDEGYVRWVLRNTPTGSKICNEPAYIDMCTALGAYEVVHSQSRTSIDQTDDKVSSLSNRPSTHEIVVAEPTEVVEERPFLENKTEAVYDSPPSRAAAVAVQQGPEPPPVDLPRRMKRRGMLAFVVFLVVSVFAGVAVFVYLRRVKRAPITSPKVDVHHSDVPIMNVETPKARSSPTKPVYDGDAWLSS